MRADVTGKRELLEKLLQPLRVLALVGVDLRVRTLEIGGAEYARCAVARPSDEYHIQIVALDDAIEMSPDERQCRARSPVAQQTVLHVLGLERLLEQRVVAQVDHPH